jgi:hypothetical protein
LAVSHVLSPGEKILWQTPVNVLLSAKKMQIAASIGDGGASAHFLGLLLPKAHTMVF